MTQTTRLLVQTQDEMLGEATVYTQLTVVLPFWKYIHYNIPTRALTDLRLPHLWAWALSTGLGLGDYKSVIGHVVVL